MNAENVLFLNFAVASFVLISYHSWRMTLWSPFKLRLIDHIPCFHNYTHGCGCLPWVFILVTCFFCLTFVLFSGHWWGWSGGYQTFALVSWESCLAFKLLSYAAEEKPNPWEVCDKKVLLLLFNCFSNGWIVYLFELFLIGNLYSLNLLVNILSKHWFLNLHLGNLL